MMSSKTVKLIAICIIGAMVLTTVIGAIIWL